MSGASGRSFVPTLTATTSAAATATVTVTTTTNATKPAWYLSRKKRGKDGP